MVGKMSSVKKGIAAAVALVMVATVLAGCTDDDNGITWEYPTRILLSLPVASDENEWIVINITLGDSSALVTQADGTFRVAIFDDDDVEMLNKTWEVKKDDFAEWKTGGVTNTAYELHIPYADITKSGARGGTMYTMVWFTWKDQSFTDDWHLGIWGDPSIPDALLLPNTDPVADLSGPTTGFTDVEIEFDASGSSDAEDDVAQLDFEWEWGDGRTTGWPLAGEIESHTYDEPGTYTVTVNVSDTEDAFDIVTMDITIDWVLAITVEGTAMVTDPGEHFNDTWYEVKIMNQAAEEVSLPALDAWLHGVPETPLDTNGTDIDLPSSLPAGDSVSVRIYFIVPEEFDATDITVMGRTLSL